MINRLNMRATLCWLLLRWLKRTPPTAAGSRLTLGIVDRTLLLLLLVILVKKLQVQNQDMKSIHSTLSSFQYVSSSFHLHAQCRMHIPLKGSAAPHIPEPLSWRIVCSHGLQVFLADKWLLLQDEALLVWLLLCQIVMAHCLQGSESSWKIYIFTEHLSLNIQKHLKRGYHKNKKMVHMHFQMAFLGPNKPCFSNFPTIY